jgi:class 3 adenylate cyclase
MSIYPFKTLRARLTVLLISPVVILLIAAGAGGFIYARQIMLEQWNESVMLRLERAAHEIEMQLSKPVELMTLFADSGAGTTDASLLEAIVQQLESLPSVVRVNLNWHMAADSPQYRTSPYPARGMRRFMRFRRGTFTRISPPRIDTISGQQTVSVTMVLMDAYDTPVGNLEIVLKFEDLVAEIAANVWWQSALACIADRASGEIVLNSGLMEGRNSLGETEDALELAIKHRIAEKTAGTLWDPGHPPRRVAGYHSLQTFPWTLVVFADGQTILAPIITFRNGFIVGAALLIIAVYGVILLNVNRMSAVVRQLSQRAEMVAAGDYGKKIASTDDDEIGRLARSFNTMVDGLKERDTIRNTFGLYVNPKFARALLNRPEAAQLGGRRQDVAILMADIRGFTPMTENMSPEATIDVLNRYFSAIIPLIQKHAGIIVDFVGDGLLAFFEPGDASLKVTARRCVACAFEMQTAMNRLNRQMDARGLPVIEMGIGVNCGSVVVGNIGSETRKKYGIVGASVNITQRIQGQSEAGEVIIAGPVYDMIRADIAVKRTFSTGLKGVASPLQLYAVVPHHSDNLQP